MGWVAKARTRPLHPCKRQQESACALRLLCTGAESLALQGPDPRTDIPAHKKVVDDEYEITYCESGGASTGRSCLLAVQELSAMLSTYLNKQTYLTSLICEGACCVSARVGDMNALCGGILRTIELTSCVCSSVNKDIKCPRKKIHYIDFRCILGSLPCLHTNLTNMYTECRERYKNRNKKDTQHKEAKERTGNCKYRKSGEGHWGSEF